MSSYVSRWTGRQIDDSIGSIHGGGFADVVGIIQRDLAGNFSAAQSLPAAENGTTISVVTTGEKYQWNHTIPLAQKGVSNGVAPLNSSGLIDAAFLPAFVDDVLEFNTIYDFPLEGESGKIYIDISTNLTYRWSGSIYVEISKSLALGETSSTAYRGDRGKIAYDHAIAKGEAFTTGLYKISTNNEGHVTGATEVTKTDITALGIPSENTTYTFIDNHPVLSWGEQSTIATIGDVAIHATMPNNPNTNTTYSFESAINGFTVTPSDGESQIITVTPEILNNITGSGANGYLVKFNSTNTITNGPALGEDTTTFLRNDGQWIAPPNTTYESLSADELSTQVSLVTRQEKYHWNEKLSTSDIGVSIVPLTNGKIDNSYLPELSKVEITRHLTSGVRIATFTVDEEDITIYAPAGGGGGGGSTITIDPVITSGTKIATVSIDGVDTDLFTPVYENKTATLDGLDLSLVTTGDKYSWNNKANTTSTNITLSLNNWNNLSQTVLVQGVTSTNDVIIVPSRATAEKYNRCGIVCESQGTNSLTFSAEKLPDASLTVNILIID